MTWILYGWFFWNHGYWESFSLIWIIEMYYSYLCSITNLTKSILVYMIIGLVSSAIWWMSFNQIYCTLNLHSLTKISSKHLRHPGFYICFPYFHSLNYSFCYRESSSVQLRSHFYLGHDQGQFWYLQLSSNVLHLSP